MNPQGPLWAPTGTLELERVVKRAYNRPFTAKKKNRALGLPMLGSPRLRLKGLKRNEQKIRPLELRWIHQSNGEDLDVSDESPREMPILLFGYEHQHHPK